MKAIAGFTLIELMVGLFLSSFIMAMLTHIYLKNTQQFQRIEQSLQIDMEMQGIQELLSYSIRQAGYTPCVSLSHLGMEPMHFIGSKHEIIELIRMGEPVLKVIETPNIMEVVVSNSKAIENESRILIADCQSVEIHRVDRVSNLGLNIQISLKEPMRKVFKNAYVGPLIRERWGFEAAHHSLYYQVGRKEEVSHMINQFIVHPRVGQPNLIDVVLGANNGSEVRFSTAIRG